MALGSLNIRIGADIREFQQKMRDINKQTRQMSRDLADIGKGLSTAITLPVVGIATAAIKMSADFESSMNRVRAISGATGEEFEMLRSVAKKLGAETQFSASQAADGLTILSQAGFNARQAAETLPGVLSLAAAGGIEIAEAAGIAAAALKGFNLDVRDAARVGDVLTATANATFNDVTLLGEAFRDVGPVAAGLGLEFEEVASVLGILGDAGIQGSRAGTALKRSLATLINPSKQQADIMRRLGLHTMDATGAMVPMRDILRQLQEAGADTSDIMALFGSTAGPAMAALISKGADAVEELLEKNLNSAGEAARIAEENMRGFNGQMEELKSAAEGLMIAIGEAGLLQRVTGLAKGATELTQRLAKTNPELLNIVTNIGLIAAGIGPVLIGIAQMIKAVGTLRKSITLLDTTLKILSKSPVLIALTAITAAAYGATKQISKMNKALREGAGVNEATVRSGMSGPGTSANIFAMNTGRDRSAQPQIGAGIVRQLDSLGVGLEKANTEIGPLLSRMNDVVSSTKEEIDYLDQFNDGLEEAKKTAKELAEERKAAAKAEKERAAAIALARKGDIAPSLADTIKSYEKNVKLDDLKISTDQATASQTRLAAISQKVSQSLSEQIVQMTEADFKAQDMALAMAKVGDAMNIMATSMARVADAGGTFSEVADELRKSAQKIIGAMIRQGVVSVVSGALTKNAFLGPLAIPIGVAAGALAQGAFNSIINKIKVPAFADGGLVFGRTLGLMGEYSNAANNPEVIAPLDRLKSLIGPQNISVEVFGRLSGRDILLSNERTTLSQVRKRGY